MDDNYKTPLIAAVGMAVRNNGLPDGAIFHSAADRITRQESSKALKRMKISQPVGRSGCYDNALVKSFNGTVKDEPVYRTIYPTTEKTTLRDRSDSPTIDHAPT